MKSLKHKSMSASLIYCLVSDSFTIVLKLLFISYQPIEKLHSSPKVELLGTLHYHTTLKFPHYKN